MATAGQNGRDYSKWPERYDEPMTKCVFPARGRFQAMCAASMGVQVGNTLTSDVVDLIAALLQGRTDEGDRNGYDEGCDQRV